MAFVTPPVEGEGDRLRAVDATALRETEGLRHLRPLRRRFAHSVDGADLVRHRIARDIEPAAAAEAVEPALAMQPLRIAAIVEIFRPVAIGRRCRIGALQM